MKFLNHLNLVENELRYAKMYRVPHASYSPGGGSGPSGNIIMDTTDDIPKWWDGGAWRDFSYNTTGGTNTTYDMLVVQNSGSNSNPILRLDPSTGTNDDITITGGSNVTVTRNSATQLTIASSFTNTTYSALTNTTLGLAKTRFSTINNITPAALTDVAARTYGIQKNSSDQLVVTVPWETNTNTTYTAGVGLTLNTTTFDANTWGANNAASAAADTTDTSAKWYGVMTDSNDKLVVRVPWTDTTTNTQNAYEISAANGTNTSREKIVLTGSGAAGSTTDFVEIGAGTGLSIARSGDVITLTNTVTDTNTTYSAGTNLTLTGTTFDVPVLTNTTLGVAKTRYSNIFNGTAVSLGDAFTTSRVYGVIKDTSNRLVVEVPWQNTVTTNTDANYALSVGAVSSNESTLSLTGSSGGSTTTAKFSGTTNEIEITTPATGNGGDITIGLPDDVTIGNDLTVTNDCVITGDLTVNGATTTLDTTNTAIKDNIIVLNTGATGSFGSSGTSGIEVERGGTLPHSQVLWNDQTNKWTCSIGDTSLQMTNIIQNVFTTATGNSGTATANSTTTALALTGSNGITTTAANQGVTISGGTGITPTAVATITAAGAGGLNASTNKIATLTHNLGTKDVVVRLYEVGTGENTNYTEIYADVTATSTSVVTVQFSANLSSNVRAVIVAAKSATAITPTYS